MVEQAISVVSAAEAQEVQRLLLHPHASLADTVPTREQAEHLLPTLRARLANARRRHLPVLGLRQAIERIAALPPDEIVLGYGVSAPTGNANVYFTQGHAGLKPVGVMAIAQAR